MSEFAKVKHPNPTNGSGATNRFLIDFALVTGDSVGYPPRKGPSNFVDKLHDLNWNVQRGKVVDFLGREDRLDQSSTARKSVVLTPPRKQLTDNLILKMLEMIFLTA